MAKAGVTIIKAGLLESRAPAPQFEMFCDRALSWTPDLGEHVRFPRNVPMDGKLAVMRRRGLESYAWP
jgi:hypothetical protein